MSRLARVTSLSFAQGKPLEQVVNLVAEKARQGCDLIALPETWRGQGVASMEALDGPTIRALSALARRYASYIICPIDRQAGSVRLNTAVLLDRTGEIAGWYDKYYPYWSELELVPPVTPGTSVPVFRTDFGVLGLAVCFDVNFPEVWQRLADQGAELVIWSSAYSAGSSLQAHALQHHYYVVSSTCTCDCLAYDITGKLLHDQYQPGLNISRLALDLDRGIYHYNFNLAKRDRLLADHAGEVEQELCLDREQWFVLRSRVPQTSARELASEYGLEEL
ncbi:MAG: carbon-nitrogen hydrolase family protein, partial [Anaerolineae bacterium]